MTGRALPSEAFRAALAEALRAPLKNDEQRALLAVHVEYLGLPRDGPVAEDALAQAQGETLRRLAAVGRPQDVLAHLDAHRFLLLLNGVSGAPHASLAAHRIHAELQGGVADVARAARVGIALAPEHTADADELIRLAWIAADHALQARDGQVVFDPVAHGRARRVHDLTLPLRAALDGNELDIHFQPQVYLEDGRLYGFEALLRWQLDGQWVPPLDVVATALHCGLSHRLTRWIVNAALCRYASMRDAGVDVQLSINLQPADLEDPRLADFMELALETWSVPAQRVTLEITENSVIGDLEGAIALLERIKALGVHVSLDDFGTGFSSLTHLRRLPLDELKVDQSFVRSMLTVPRDEQIVDIVISLANNFGLLVVAEGVEDEATAARLCAMGCQVMQGYLVAPALDEAAAVAFARSYEGSPARET